MLSSNVYLLVFHEGVKVANTLPKKIFFGNAYYIARMKHQRKPLTVYVLLLNHVMIHPYKVIKNIENTACKSVHPR